LHPPGGVVGGDELSIDVNLAARAQVLVTTPAAGKFYRSSGLTACQRQHLQLAPRAALEWFPQENILFDGARVTLQTRVELSEDSSFMGWEIMCLGRPASGEGFATGEVRTGFEIWRDKIPLWVERSCFAGGAALLSAPWGLGGQAVTGSFVCVAPPPEAVDAVRAATQEFADDERFGVTRLGEALVCRYLGDSAPRARQLFQRAWEVLRPLMHGRVACPPRIWHT
jgi:urease accessory protein